MKNLYSSSLTRTDTTVRSLTIATALAAPFLIHLIPPIGATMAGAVLLPMFIAPLLASAWRMRMLAGISLFLPLVNMLIMGHPEPLVSLILTFEIAMFLLITWNWNRLRLPAWLVGVTGYLGAKAGSIAMIFTGGLSFSLNTPEPIGFAFESILNGWPGLVLLTILSLGLFKNPDGH